MSLVVQKYGGSSLATLDDIRRVAAQISRSQNDVEHLVIVVSAMGHSTDWLLPMAEAVQTRPSPRELDLLLSTGEIRSAALLALALRALSVPAWALTGSQAVITTCPTHGSARVVNVAPGGVLSALRAGMIPVVAGYQGASQAGEVTTLGRGASDITAVAGTSDRVDFTPGRVGCKQ